MTVRQLTGATATYDNNWKSINWKKAESEVKRLIKYLSVRDKKAQN